MGTRHGKIRGLIVAAVLLSNVAFASDDDCEALVEAFRMERMADAFFLEGYPVTAVVKELAAAGPNALPALVEAIRLEERKDVRDDLVGMFHRLGGFRTYLYQRPPGSDTLRHPVEKDTESLPLLSRELGAGLGSDEKAARALAWWERRGTFLEQANQLDRLRACVGRTVDEALAMNLESTFAFRKAFAVYGIYSLPVYIHCIAEDNNPFVFMQFLAGWRRDEIYSEPPISKAQGAEVITAVQDAYPTVESKLEVVCGWWREKGHTFTELPGLHAAIGSALAEYCAPADSLEP